MPEPGYRAMLDRLFALRRFGMRPGLEVIEALLEALDRPQRAFRAVHVAGSKGKGSVSAMTAAVLGAAGRHVGLFTSPHLVSYRERIRVAGAMIDRDEVVRGVARVDGVAEELQRSGRIDRPPTFFETTTALAFDRFRAAGVTEAVIEVGLGGRLDSTNVLAAPVGLVTTLELEHTDVLGPTIEAIAREKAGILHHGMRAVLGELVPAARAEVERTAQHEGVPVEHLHEELRVSDRRLDERGQVFTVATPRATHPDLRLALAGLHQAGNAAMAVAAAELLAEAVGFELPERAVREGLRAVQWRGRLERLARRPDLYLDVAHTPGSARAVAAGLGELRPFADAERSALLFGCLADKRAEEILEALSPLARTVVLVPIASDRSMPMDRLQRAAAGRFRKITVAPDVATGLLLARAATGPEGLTLATGSDYLVGDVLRKDEGSPDDEPDLSDTIAPTSAGGAR